MLSHLGKDIFLGLIKEFMMNNSWIIQVDLKSIDKFLIEDRSFHKQKRKKQVTTKAEGRMLWLSICKSRIMDTHGKLEETRNGFPLKFSRGGEAMPTI
jgi:hypothetical protein